MTTQSAIQVAGLNMCPTAAASEYAVSVACTDILGGRCSREGRGHVELPAALLGHIVLGHYCYMLLIMKHL